MKTHKGIQHQEVRLPLGQGCLKAAQVIISVKVKALGGNDSQIQLIQAESTIAAQAHQTLAYIRQAIFSCIEEHIAPFGTGKPSQKGRLRRNTYAQLQSNPGFHAFGRSTHDANT
jgi:hypothetical protein